MARTKDDAFLVEGVTEEALKKFLTTRLNKIEMPKDIIFRDALPKTMIGKLSRTELVAEEKAKAAGRNAA